MYTLFFGSASKAFQMILKAFTSPPLLVLDLTYGKGNSWKDIDIGSDKLWVVKIDKVEYDGVKLDIQGDHATNLPFPDEVFDVVYYDPPYYFKEFVKDKGVGALYADDREIYWTLDDFKHSLTGLRREVPRVLKKGGILICKIMDSYVGRTYFPNTFAVFNCFSQLLSPIGVFIVPIHRENYPDTVRVNHINYLVFKKGVDATQYRVGYDIRNLLNDTDSSLQ